MSLARTGLGISLALFLSACGEASARFDVKHEPDFPPSKPTVSVFGVFRNGRLDAEVSGQVGPRLAAALGQRSCGVAYGGVLSREDPEFTATLEEHAQTDGVTDELLEKVAPLAGGELILVLSMQGEAKVRSLSVAEINGNTGPQASMRGAPMRRAYVPSRMRGLSAPGLAVKATLYSVKQRRSVARVTMSYDGPTMDDAINRLAAELGQVLPGASCQPWRVDVKR